MEAPKLAWLGNDPVVVGDAVPDHPDGHLQVWRFVSGSAVDAHPDTLDYGEGQSARKSAIESDPDAAPSGRVLDFSGVGTAGSEPGNVPAQAGATSGDLGETPGSAAQDPSAERGGPVE